MRSAIYLAALMAATAANAAGSFAPAETAAIYRGAGFKMVGGKPVGCSASEPSWPRSDFSIEAVDLNGDGKLEAIVSEGNVACYGRDEQFFTVVARNPDGSWRKLGGESGIAVPIAAKHGGWRDIEVGGPGFAKRPVMRWNGKGYAL